MGFKLIKKGSYTYKRVGSRKTSYCVTYRAGGIVLDKVAIEAADDKDAIRKAREMISQAERAKVRGAAMERASAELPRFDALAEIDIAAKVSESSRKTAKYYLEKHVLPWFNIHCPYVSEFNQDYWDRFVAYHLQARPGQRLFNPRKYFRQVLKRGIRRLSPEQRAKMGEVKLWIPDPKTQAGKVYSDDEMKRLFAKAGPELTLQILMAYTMGMRRSEILKLRWDRLQWDRRTIRLEPEDTKIRQGREFMVNPEVWKLLLARKKEIQGVDYVFPSRKNPRAKVFANRPIQDNKTAWQACKREAKVTGRFHDLRHTFLTNEISRKKHQAMDVCIYAGLSLEELKKTYLHPDWQDTAYIADSQTEKVLPWISENLRNNLRNENGGKRNAS